MFVFTSWKPDIVHTLKLFRERPATYSKNSIAMYNNRFEVCETADRGRGLFSRSNFNENEIIFEEEPFISCQFAWNEDYGYKACEFCLRPLETAEENVNRLSMGEFMSLPFPELCNVDKTLHTCCSFCGVMYCSSNCRELAWFKYHKTLCYQTLNRNGSLPLERLKEIWKQIHFPPETTTALIFAKIFAMIYQSDERNSLKEILQKFCHHTSNETENIKHKFLGLKFSEQVETLRQAIQAAVPTEYAEEWITPEGFGHLIALVGRNGQGIGTSSFSNWVKNISQIKLPTEKKLEIDNYVEKIYDNFEKGVGDFLNNEGAGLYVLQSTINHSCKPNAEINFPNSDFKLAVKALRQINIGEEICISYLDNCVLERSRHSRQRILKENYLFTCKCEKCESEVCQPDETSSEDDEDEDEDDDGEFNEN